MERTAAVANQKRLQQLENATYELRNVRFLNEQHVQRQAVIATLRKEEIFDELWAKKRIREIRENAGYVKNGRRSGRQATQEASQKLIRDVVQEGVDAVLKSLRRKDKKRRLRIANLKKDLQEIERFMQDKKWTGGRSMSD